MTSLFHYNTLDVQLESFTKSLHIKFKEKLFRKECLFELEGLYSWLMPRLEINAVIMRSDENFPCKWDEQEWNNFSSADITHINRRMQKIVFTKLVLPQVFIVDLKEQANSYGLEFSLGADFRICHIDSQISFNQLSNGVIPSSGGLSLLHRLVGQAYTKKWIFSEGAIPNEELLNSGLISYIYQEKPDQYLNKLLKKINQQSPIARIQAKGALYKMLSQDLDACMSIEEKYSNANLTTGDYKNKSTKFSSPKDLAKLIQFERGEKN